VRKREELEAALARANQEIAQLKEANSQSTDPQDSTTTAVDLLDQMAETASIVAPKFIDMNTVAGLGLGTEGQQLVEPQEEYVQVKIDRDNGAREFHALLDRSKVAALFSPSSVIQSPYDEDCAPSYSLCPILQVAIAIYIQYMDLIKILNNSLMFPLSLQEVMRDPHVAADGFTYEADAIRGWLEAGREVSPGP
jgi:hypothetical protein